LFAGCVDCGDTNFEVAYEEKKLDKGKQLGTFTFVYKVHFRENFNPDFPVHIQIRKGTMYGKILYSRRVEMDEETFIYCDLHPGSYSITSSPVEEIHSKEFWNGFGPQFEIDKSGLLKYYLADFYHKRKIKVDCPQGELTIPDKKSSLKMEWIPVQDAVSYAVIWEIESYEKGEILKKFKIRRIKETKFEFNFDIDSDWMKENKYQIYWMLHAYNNSGIPIGFASNQFTVKIKK
jgi:hypothetical protein